MIRKVAKSVKVFVGAQAVLGAATTGMAAVRILRPREGRRIAQERIGTWAGRAILDLCRIELVVHRDGPWPEGPVFYMANHTSSLDLPILMALGFPNSRTFIKERFRWYGTLGAALTLTGTLFTAPQDDHSRRVERFKRAEAILRRTGDSVFGTPEGTRIEGGELGRFNRGVFHIVTHLKLPIVPVMIVIPPEINPGRAIAGPPGRVEVFVGEPIDTGDWCVEDIDTNKERVRDHFVAWQQELQA